MLKYLSDAVKITRVKAAQTAGTSEVESDSVDMQGFDGVAFVGSYGTPAANNLCHLEQSSDDGDSDSFADLTGSEPDEAGSSTPTFVLQIAEPRERYVRSVWARGTSTTLGDVYAFQFNSRKLGVDSVSEAGTLIVNSLYRPAEGTK